MFVRVISGVRGQIAWYQIKFRCFNRASAQALDELNLLLARVKPLRCRLNRISQHQGIGQVSSSPDPHLNLPTESFLTTVGWGDSNLKKFKDDSHHENGICNDRKGKAYSQLIQTDKSWVMRWRPPFSVTGLYFSAWKGDHYHQWIFPWAAVVVKRRSLLFTSTVNCFNVLADFTSCYVHISIVTGMGRTAKSCFPS